MALGVLLVSKTIEDSDLFGRTVAAGMFSSVRATLRTPTN
jgi:hypothetical protein